MAKKNKTHNDVDEVLDDDALLDGEIELPRVRVVVQRRFHAYKRGDDLIVELNSFNQALLDNGTFTEVHSGL